MATLASVATEADSQRAPTADGREIAGCGRAAADPYGALWRAEGRLGLNRRHRDELRPVSRAFLAMTLLAASSVPLPGRGADTGRSGPADGRPGRADGAAGRVEFAAAGG